MRQCIACDKKHLARGYCSTHYHQWRIHGKLLIKPIFIKNEIFDRGDYLEMAINKQNGDIIGYIKLDRSFLEKIKRFKWNLSTGGYAIGYNSVTKKIIWMHHLILFRKKGFVTDHINEDKLDNRQENLRYATPSENIARQTKRNIIKSSKYKGVCWNKERNCWVASICQKGKRCYFYSNNEHHAAFMYDFWAIELFGEFASTNFTVIAHT